MDARHRQLNAEGFGNSRSPGLKGFTADGEVIEGQKAHPQTIGLPLSLAKRRPARQTGRMDDMAAQKTAARKAAFARRKEARSADADAQAAAHLLNVLLPLKGRPMAGYMPIQTEIDPLPAMYALQAYGPVGVPVIQGEGQPLRFKSWSPEAEMEEGPFKAKVPVRGAWITPQVVIVPLVAFTAEAHRLGYGGGFYDRTLALLRRAGAVTAIGYAYSAQMAQTLPQEPTDEPLDMIVTELGVLSP
jgi:5-formyltetrahydrofolate cyclo-ligase